MERSVLDFHWHEHAEMVRWLGRTYNGSINNQIRAVGVIKGAVIRVDKQCTLAKQLHNITEQLDDREARKVLR